MLETSELHQHYFTLHYKSSMLGHGFLDFLQREQGLQDLVRQIGLGLALCADLERRATIDEASLVYL